MTRTTNTHVLLAHGGGGQLMAELVEQIILPALGGQNPSALTDAAEVRAGQQRLLFTTDSYVVTPLEFTGGDIGKLSICGTINDLAVSGGKPLAISMGLVLEEGLDLAIVQRMLESAGKTARAAGVPIVTGDTKVVERRGEPGMMINTAGIGVPLPGADLSFTRVTAGDAVILSGPLGQHGLAVMSRRKGLSIAATLASDCASLFDLTAALIGQLGAKVKWMRDPTRGGLAATMAELSAATGRNIDLHQRAIPVDPQALAVAEMLGLDLLSVANEGKLVAIVAAEVAEQAVDILRQFEISRRAACIGAIGETAQSPLVEMTTRIGGRRIVQMPYGEDLPRIC